MTGPFVARARNEVVRALGQYKDGLYLEDLMIITRVNIESLKRVLGDLHRAGRAEFVRYGDRAGVFRMVDIYTEQVYITMKGRRFLCPGPST